MAYLLHTVRHSIVSRVRRRMGYMENFQLPVADEHELLESTIQHLYGLGLKLEACLQEAQCGGHRDTIDGAINTIGEMIDTLRARIELLEGRRYLRE